MRSRLLRDARARILVATFWVGSLWTIGYLVAPTLFATLADRMLAGTIAGRLFRVEAWVSVCSAALLALLVQYAAKGDGGPDRRACLRLIGLMFLCTLVGYFALQPQMAALRAGGVMTGATLRQFGILHGISSGIYLVQSLLGLFLVFRIR